MKERPILFSAPMVRAILDGRKTMTRRIVKHPHIDDADIWTRAADDLGRWAFGCASGAPGSYGHGDYVRCPYGEPGDRLWVRETFAPYRAVGAPCSIADATYVVLADGAQIYRDGNVSPALAKYAPGAFDSVKWRPSIHMPRWASRITLEVTCVRVERLHAITGRDVLAEGIDNGKSNPAQGERWENMQRLAFESLWSEINGADSWAANPWVWVVEFKRAKELLDG